MNSNLHCAANCLVSQGLDFHTYKIKSRKVPVNNQSKLQFQGFFCIVFHVADYIYMYKKGVYVNKSI